MTEFQVGKSGDEVKPRERPSERINRWDPWWKEGIISCLKPLSWCVVMSLIEKETWEECYLEERWLRFAHVGNKLR